MGVVYLAEQLEPVRRTVALKVLRADRGSDQVLARFQAERQALAVMDHPSIAKIFDAGITEDGDSYFAMERVEGLPINEFCDQRRMPLRARLRLFVEACRAVQHAHQKGLIHRDLKPSNLLVTEVDGRPLPRIIDFGIAKAVEAEQFDGTRLTRDDQIIGTPAYMSPEQIDGSADIDTRSDIYSLGILLYELLAGTLPYDLGAYRGWAAVAAAIHREPPTVSQRLSQLPETQETVARQRSTTLGVLRKELRGDLDWIVARAMEKDRNRRYETANALALDLERFLDHQPVRARGTGTAYVLRKFVRRNRAAVAFGATVGLGLLAFAVTTAVQARRIAEARDVADARRAQAEGLIDFMLGDLRTKLQSIGRLEIMDDVGTEAMAYFAALPEKEFTDDELARRSKALYQIGEVRAGEGRLSDARAAFEESLRLAREFSTRDPSNPERLYALGQSEFWVGYMDWRTGRFEDALLHFYPYREASERLVAMDSANLDWRLELGYASSNIGSIREAMGDFTGAVESFRATLAVDSFMVGRQPGSTDRQLDLARSHNALAVALTKAGDLESAELHHRTELAIKEELVRADPDNTVLLRELSLGDRYLASVLELRGADVEALHLVRRGLAVSRRLTETDPANADWRDGLAVSLAQRGTVLLRVDSLDAAARALDESRSLLERLVAENPGNPRWLRMSSLACYGQARVTQGRAQSLRALAWVQEADSLLAPMLAEGSDPEAVELDTHLRLLAGDALAAADDPEGARREWGIAAGGRPGSDPSRETALTRAARAGALLRLGAPARLARC